MGSLSINPNLCLFHSDKLVLWSETSFIPKVNSVFHRAQELNLPTLCPRPSSKKERMWHSLVLCRALRCYTNCNKDLRKTEALFVTFARASIRKRASLSSLSRWLKLAIHEAYKAAGKEPPQVVTMQSTRGAGASAVFDGIASLESICKAATWSILNTFIRYYKIDQVALAEAAFGHRVLKRVVPQV